METIIMIPEKLLEVLKQGGVVAIATSGQDGTHMVNTWNNYIKITDDERILIPVGYMNRTEANIGFNNNVLITLGSSKVTGTMGPGTGFLIKGTAAFITSGADFDIMKEKFSWARATLAVTTESITQTL
jgi:predicted pyridoxine 5'-phosphate oxidase superfamily flavin-nucleotide-binding protein